MYIKNIKLKNFRNYKQLDISLSKNINIFIGDNAQGKTNILESVVLSAAGRTHRTSKDKELINLDADNYLVGIDFVRSETESNIFMSYNNDKGRLIKVNGIPIKKIRELIGNLVVVISSPEDLNIIKGTPAERRRFIDMTISQIRPVYFANLQEYSKILKHRNAFLKENTCGKYDKMYLEVLDSRLISVGTKIIEARLNFIDLLNNKTKVLHEKLTNFSERVEIIYLSSVGAGIKDSIENIKSKFQYNLTRNIDFDFRRKTTSNGPHRDDLKIDINNMDSKAYGSQGQQKTSILSLTMGKLELIKDEIGEYPVLLLDDITSELDDKRIQRLFESLDQMQVLITMTSGDNKLEKILNNKKMYIVKDGGVC